MNILSSLLLLPSYLWLCAWQIEETTTQIYLTVVSTQAMASCPICHQAAHRIHSHYERTLADLPWSEYGVSWQLQVRKFFCTNPDCPRRINTIAFAWGGGALGTKNLSPEGTTGSYRLGAGWSCRNAVSSPSESGS